MRMMIRLTSYIFFYYCRKEFQQESYHICIYYFIAVRLNWSAYSCPSGPELKAFSTVRLIFTVTINLFICVPLLNGAIAIFTGGYLLRTNWNTNQLIYHIKRIRKNKTIWLYRNIVHLCISAIIAISLCAILGVGICSGNWKKLLLSGFYERGKTQWHITHAANARPIKTAVFRETVCEPTCL